MKTGKRSIFQLGKRRAAGETRILNAGESPERERDHVLKAPSDAQAWTFPESFDVRTTVPSPLAVPYNQGQTGSCVGQAVKVGLHHALYKARLIRRTHHRYSPSAKHIWEQSKELDRYNKKATTMVLGAGTYVRDAIHPLITHGCATERMYPMDSPGTRVDEGQWNILCQNNRIKSYVALSPYGRRHNFEGYKLWLANEGPIITRLIVDQQFLRGHKPLEAYRRDTNYGHAVCVTAYKPGYFLVRNSWGKNWGEDGYRWVAVNYARAAFTESYGIKA